MIKLLRSIYFNASAFLLLIALPLFSDAQTTNHSFSISFIENASHTPITGRVFLAFSRNAQPEPRYEAGSYFTSIPFWAKDVDQMQPGKDVMIDTNVTGYPIASLRDLPAGDYYVQAVLNVYTQYHRADGHTIWAHQDQWEGQHFNTSPGNLISAVQKIHYDPSQSQTFSIKLDSVLPTINLPADTKQVKHIKIKSKILSDFWGHDMYLGATILLPKGFDEHPNVHYPVVYEQSHFGLGAPDGFTTENHPIPAQYKKVLDDYNLEDGYTFQQQYNSAQFPRMIVVNFQHPTPYYDDSYAVLVALRASASIAQPLGDSIDVPLLAQASACAALRKRS